MYVINVYTIVHIFISTDYKYINSANRILTYFIPCSELWITEKTTTGKNQNVYHTQTQS